jgi:hypothetical protein
MMKKEVKLFDGMTIFLLVILIGLISVITGLIYWKESHIEVGFSFVDQNGKNKKLDQIVKEDRIFISFSGPIRTETIADNLTIEPQIDYEIKAQNNHQLVLEIKENLIPDFDYDLKIKEFQSKWGIKNKAVETTFSTDPLPQLKATFPEDKFVGLPVNQELVFEFEEPVPSQYFFKIKTEPSFEFKIIDSREKNKVIIEPVENLVFDTEYKITGEVKSQRYLDFERNIFETSFKTERPPTVVYGWNESGEPTKTEFRTELLEPAIETGRYIDIDLSDQNLYIFENGQELGAFKVSTGIRGMATPVGEFQVMGKARRPWSAKYGLYMPWFIQFTNQGHGIHELPEWPGGYKEGANHLGIAVSHGCVRLGIGPAKKVYDFVEVGIPIVIHY